MKDMQYIYERKDNSYQVATSTCGIRAGDTFQSDGRCGVRGSVGNSLERNLCCSVCSESEGNPQSHVLSLTDKAEALLADSNNHSRQGSSLAKMFIGGDVYVIA